MRAALLSLSVVIGLGEFAVGTMPEEVGSAPVPAALREYHDLANRCARYDEMTTGTTWRTVYSEDFSDRMARRTWGLGPDEQDRDSHGCPRNVSAAVEHAEEDGRHVLLFNAAMSDDGLLKIGPKVSGDFAIEFVAKALDERPQDLSIVCDGLTSSPAFRFGTCQNSRNLLYVGPRQNTADAAQATAELPRDTLIREGVWHRVRMEVRRSEVIAAVDGRILGRAALTREYDTSAKRQPLIYVDGGQIALDDVRIQLPDKTVTRGDEQQAWGMAFGLLTRPEVRARLDQLADMLSDEDSVVRETAQEMLKRAGRLAEGPLTRVARGSISEQQQRAEQLLRSLRAVNSEAAEDAHAMKNQH